MKTSPVLLALTLLLSISPAFSEPSEPRYIEVYGDAEVVESPNYAEIDFSVIVQDKKLEKAKEVFGERDAIVGEALSVAGFAVESIYALNPRIRPVLKDNKMEEDGYRIEKKYLVVSTDEEQINNFLHTLANAGVSTIQGVTYKSSRVKEFETTALVAAAEDARTRAQALATKLGVELGDTLNVQQESSQIFRGNHSEAEFDAFSKFGSSSRVSASSAGGQLHFEARVILKISIK